MNTKETPKIILEAKDVSVEFDLRGKVLKALRSCSLRVAKGETVAIVGESGSGKSVFSKTFTGTLDRNGRITGGEIIFDGIDVSRIDREKDWLGIRGARIATIFQDPATALDPLMKIGEQVRESIVLHRGISGSESKAAAVEALAKVGIRDPGKRYNSYPHEFSGGMRQRVVIASAIACNPEILICDEPTTALDVTIQSRILDLIEDIKRDMGMSVIFITHDLGVVARIADKVAVMYAGEIIEEGLSSEVFYDPRHPYTWALLASMPQLGMKGEELFSIRGTPPNLFADIKGDPFAPRNPDALAVDFVESPPWFEVSPTHRAKTWLLDPRAPSIEAPDIVGRLREKRIALKGDER